MTEAFEPTSADDLNKQGRESEVLIEALNKCESLRQLLQDCAKYIGASKYLNLPQYKEAMALKDRIYEIIGKPDEYN